MVHAIYALNAVRNNQKTGSIVPRAIVISRTRHVSNFTLNYRPKATCHTIVAVSSPPQSIETNRDNRMCVKTNTMALVKCLCSEIRVVHENHGRGRSNEAVGKKTEEKDQREE